MIQIFHNPRCSKSRECLIGLEAGDQEIEIVKYLETAPTFEELEILLQKLAIPPIELVRKKETIWVTNFSNRTLTDREIIQAMVDHPILIERPIVINGDRAVIARPASKAQSIM